MKLLTAVIAPEHIERVTCALDDAGLTATTVATAQASGMKGGSSQKYKGVAYHDQRCVRLEVLVGDVDIDVAVAVVTTSGGAASDDVVVWVSEVVARSAAQPFAHAREVVSQR